MSEIKITYETLFDLLRREKSREELQKLDPEFYKDVQDYLREKQSILQDTSSQAELFASSEKEKIRVQFQNIKKILRELYERREKKVLHLALTQSRTQSNLTDMSILLETEKQLFHELNQLLTRYKDTTLIPLLTITLPETHVMLRNELYGPPVEASPAIAIDSNPGPTITHSGELALEQKTDSSALPAPLENGSTQTYLTLRFKASVPKFLGTELEIYGPFQANETAQLPAEIAQVLIQKGRAEEIK